MLIFLFLLLIDVHQIVSFDPHMSLKMHDLLVVGQVNIAGSISRIPVLIIDMLKNDLDMCFKHTNTYYDTGLSQELKKIVETDTNHKATVALLTDVLWVPGHDIYKKTPEAALKFAYSMNESTKIAPEWVYALNRDFDAVIVPDNFIAKVYKKSGVIIPVFELPLPIYLDDFLKKQKKECANTPFVFGCSAIHEKRKNLDLVIDSFAKTFKNNPQVHLKIHTKSPYRKKELKEKIASKKMRTISLIMHTFDIAAYADFIASLDCYLFLSKGEGFSITPREALAAGIPCIVSNNTAQKTICDSGFVYAVPSKIKEAGIYDFNGPENLKKSQDIGYQFNCSLKDSCEGLKTVYSNYDIYIKKAEKGRLWVQQYTPEHLKKKYLSLLKPQKVLLGKKNIITDTYLMTDSKKLYKKIRKAHFQGLS